MRSLLARLALIVGLLVPVAVGAVAVVDAAPAGAQVSASFGIDTCRVSMNFSVVSPNRAYAQVLSATGTCAEVWVMVISWDCTAVSAWNARSNPPQGYVVYSPQLSKPVYYIGVKIKSKAGHWRMAQLSLAGALKFF